MVDEKCLHSPSRTPLARQRPLGQNSPSALDGSRQWGALERPEAAEHQPKDLTQPQQLAQKDEAKQVPSSAPADGSPQAGYDRLCWSIQDANSTRSLRP